ncbi:hypothetical protein AB990_03265 [Alkalihalobacillus pseudalcaliphilus]|nr:hypothetical protein AB990_03265 [Alkalihalobacillus pseudalcaliphilus]
MKLIGALIPVALTEQLVNSVTLYINSGDDLNDVCLLCFRSNPRYNHIFPTKNRTNSCHDEQGQLVLSSYIKSVNVLYNMLLNEKTTQKSISV